jgi:hypothetical protein
VPSHNSSETETKGSSLSELLARIKGVVSSGLPESVWARAENSEMSGKRVIAT